MSFLAFEVICHKDCKMNECICSMVLLTGVAVLKFLAKYCFVDGRREGRVPTSHTEVGCAAAGPRQFLQTLGPRHSPFFLCFCFFFLS